MENLIIKMVYKPENMNVEDTFPRYTDLGDSGFDMKALGIAEKKDGKMIFSDIPEEGIILKPVYLGGAPVLFRTGVAMQLPIGSEGQLRPRSGLSSKGIIALFGTCDACYRGETTMTIINLGNEDFVVKCGDRLAQLVICPILTPNLKAVVLYEDNSVDDDLKYYARIGNNLVEALNNPHSIIRDDTETQLTPTKRGDNGIGSSGI